MKRFILVLILTISNTTYAGELYFGGSMGQSLLTYDLQGRTYEYIATEPEIAQINGVVHVLGGDVVATSDQTSSYKKFFIGYRINRYVGVEIFDATMKEYSVAAVANASVSPSATGGAYNANLSGNMNAEYTGTADFSGYGLRVNGYVPLNKKFDFFGGIGVMDATSVITTTSKLTGNYAYEAGYDTHGYSDSTSGGGTYESYSTKSKVKEALVPVFSIGIMYNITKNFTLRAELERIGHPFKNKSIDTASIGFQVNFKPGSILNLAKSL